MLRREKTFGIICPTCGHQFEENLPTAIFATSTVDDIKRSDFAKITCPSCANDFILNYRFAYTDEINEFIVVNDPDFVDKKARLAFSTSLGLIDRHRKNELYKHKLRITYDYETLREKIAIFENGLDDKIVELMKYFLLESEDFTYKSDQIKSFIYTKDKNFQLETKLNVGVKLDFSEILYDTIANNYQQALKNDISYLIDRSWVEEFLSTK